MSFYDVLLKLHEFIYLKLKLYDFAIVRNDFFEHQNYFIENKYKIAVVSFMIYLLSQNISFSSQFQCISAVQCANLPLLKWFVLFSSGLILLSGALQSLSEQVDWLPYVIPMSPNASVE